ncbi:uncharacterized protein LODBEIA_P07380 [Lodderomyces beijingensis]|uniref:enoyl-[acyl-carrier-protein] reductase n=1 Tax=Lodderomyces beijingensis TaxID=1775926 RepID=A0ABP0ZF99_9ASCO
MSVEGAAVTYTTPGSDFARILSETKFAIDFAKIKSDQLVLKALATPINPADLGQIIGGYNDPKRISDLGTSPNEPVSVGGNEGVYEVVHVGDAVQSFQVGDHVIPLLPSFGTWRSYAIATATDLVGVNGISIEQAATISVNPATAYQILNQFVHDWNRDGSGKDWIVTNSGNSQVSKFVSQIATRLYGVNVLSVVRDGKSAAEIDHLKQLGAKYVVSESEFNSAEFDIAKYTAGGNVRLALNGSSDSTVAALVRSLSRDGTLVTYGVVGGTKIEYDARLQLFKNLSTRSFWLTANTYGNPEFKRETVNKLVELYQRGEIVDVPYTKVEYKGGEQDLAKLVVDTIAQSKKSGKHVIFY